MRGGSLLLFFALVSIFSPPLRSDRGRLSRLLFFPLFLFFHLFFLDVAMVWKGKPASVTTGSRDRTYVRKQQLKKNQSAPRPSEHPPVMGEKMSCVSHIQPIGCQPEKTTLQANPARGLLNREKKEKKESLAAPPPSPRALLVRRKIKN